MNQDLAKFFTDFSIPETEKREKTFLEIAQQPHYENVLSNIYAFFFREEEEHGLHDLFLSTLKELIAEKTKGKNFDAFENPHVETEKHTKKGGFIDILLHSKEGAIIIENKVNHHIKGNDLDDYWNSVPASSDERKVGIILSMYRIAESQYAHNRKSAEHFINITHLDLMMRIMEKAPSYLEDASPKFSVFLEDFYHNIKNQSQSSMRQVDLKFYLEHRSPIHKAANLKYQFKDYVKNEAAKANQLLKKDLELVNKYHKDRLVYYASKENNQLMITVVFKNLLKGKNSIHVIVELHGDVKTKFQKNPTLYRGVEGADHLRNNGFEHVNGYWAHFANEYIGLSDAELSNLSESIANKINESPLFDIFNTLEEALKSSTT